MSAVFFSSDTHFCHGMVAGLRGFASAIEHDLAVIERWNSRCMPGWTPGICGQPERLK